MNASIQFGDTIEPLEDDEHEIGLQLQTGHSGFYATKFDVGAERLICENGMTAFISSFENRLTHSNPWNPGVAYNAIDAVAEGGEEISQRIADAEEQELMNIDESLLLLQDYGIGQVLEQPTADLVNALQQEVDDPAQPTLKETYDAATRALTHYTPDDVPDYVVDDEIAKAGQLLDQDGELPDTDDVMQHTLQNRSYILSQADDLETAEYWDGERETVQELSELRGLQA